MLQANKLANHEAQAERALQQAQAIEDAKRGKGQTQTKLLTIPQSRANDEIQRRTKFG